VYLGDFEIEGGLRKLTWGRADSFGPLDIINPFDYTELTDMSDVMNLKIARPLLHASYRFGQFSKVEAVFVPSFEAWRFASTGRWTPAQVGEMTGGFAPMFAQLVGATGTAMASPSGSLTADQIAALQAYAGGQLAARMSLSSLTPDTSTLDYVQGGLRFTTTIGSADIGAQYYYGYLPQPAVDMAAFAASMGRTGMALAMATTTAGVDAALAQIAMPKIVYNRYHQVGIDWAQVLLGFNVRAEVAANITGDLKGDDGAVYNPHLAWVLGFDRDLVWGINLNFQVNETITLLHDKIGTVDTEAGTDPTSTRITAMLSRKFLRDELELRGVFIWGIEDGDFLIMPALIWTMDALSLELSSGIFGGDKEGQLGQYGGNGLINNSFIKLGMTYTF
jgi:hypothetical protein